MLFVVIPQFEKNRPNNSQMAGGFFSQKLEAGGAGFNPNGCRQPIYLKFSVIISDRWIYMRKYGRCSHRMTSLPYGE